MAYEGCFDKFSPSGLCKVKAEPQNDFLHYSLSPMKNANIATDAVCVKTELKSEVEKIEVQFRPGTNHSEQIVAALWSHGRDRAELKASSVGKLGPVDDPSYSSLSPNTVKNIAKLESETEHSKNIKLETEMQRSVPNIDYVTRSPKENSTSGCIVRPKKKTLRIGTRKPSKNNTDNLKEGLLCVHCGKCFSRAEHLRIHIRIHTGDKPYKCTDCGKTFTRSGELTVHKRFHDGEKPYKCDYCGKGFSSTTHLKEHIWTHTGAKPHACTECDRSFAHAGDLVKHQRIHSDARPYPCLECGMFFRRMGTLKKHQKRHMRPTSFTCVHCQSVFRFERRLQIHLKLHCKKLGD